MGTRTLAETDGCRATWRVPYEPGTLAVVCRRGGESAASDALTTPGEPARLTLTAMADGEIAQVEARLLDARGNLSGARERTLTYTAEGAALLGVENGDVRDATPYSSPSRATHRGRAIAYLRLREGQSATLTVASEDGLTASVAL